MSSDRFASSSITENISVNNTYEMQLENGLNIKIERLNDESFIITLPSGEKRLYKIYLDSNQPYYDSYEILENGKTNTLKITNFSIGLFFFTLLIQFIMTIDDLWGLKAITKLFFQTICVAGLIFVSDTYITTLGNLIGTGEITLGIFGIPFTIFCVVGMMNAFNMIDGINGLCASLCLVCFVAIIYLLSANNITNPFLLILPVGSIVGFLMYNLGILGNRTVFLGDNGSNALGFLSAWVLIYFSNIENSLMQPVTALWLVAIPFIDAVGVIFSRILKKLKVLNSHRDHIHHKLLSQSLSPEAVFSILISISGLLALVGLLFNNNFEQSFYSFYTFLFFWSCYYLVVRKISSNV